MNIERLHEALSREAAETRRWAMICENCCWFSPNAGAAANGAGKCIRFPPTSEQVGVGSSESPRDDQRQKVLFLSTIRDSMPAVHADWTCGEFIHRKTGHTPYAPDDAVAVSLRARIAELEDRARLGELRREVTP